MGALDLLELQDEPDTRKLQICSAGGRQDAERGKMPTLELVVASLDLKPGSEPARDGADAEGERQNAYAKNNCPVQKLFTETRRYGCKTADQARATQGAAAKHETGNCKA